jgi:hypothetical protein
VGTVTNSIRIRDSATNSTAALCETFNTLDALILATGMLRVSDADVAGQSGTFVTGTPGDGETQITLSTTTGETLCGTKVYKHPSLDVYLRVSFYDVGYTTAARFAKVYYYVGTGVADGDLVPSKLSGQIEPFDTNNVAYSSVVASWSTTVIPATYTPIKASCGVDHFWIGDAGAVLFNPAAAGAQRPFSSPHFGLGLFTSLSDPSKLLITAAGELATAAAGVSSPTNLATGPVAQRYWSYDGAWVTRTPGAAGALADAAYPSVDAGVRVAPAKLVLGGEMCTFNFGFIAASTVSDLQELTVDLVGEAQTYVALRSMAPSNVNGPYLPAAAMCCPIFPWAA